MLLAMCDKGGNRAVSQKHDSLKYLLLLMEMIAGEKVLKAQILRTSGISYKNRLIAVFFFTLYMSS